MADNISTADFTGVAVPIRTTEAGGIHTPHHRDPETIAAVVAILAKLTADPATNTGLAAIASLLTTQAGFLDGLEAMQTTANGSLASILAKLSADPATQTTLAAIAALLTAHSGFLDGIEGLQTTGNGSLAAILAKLTADPATNTTLAAIASLLTTQAGYLDGIEGLLAAPTPAGELHIGSFGGNTAYIDITLTTDTAIYASGDVLADTQPIANAMRLNNGTGILQSVHLLDEDDQGLALDLIFLSANNTLGTENATVTITDVLARDILGSISFATVDYIDLGGCRIATKTGIGLVVKPETGTRVVYVAAITRGAPTYSATGLKLRLGFLQD